MIRTIHRVGSVFSVLLMLWMATTGTLMQVTDLNAVLTHAPPSDPTVLSTIEGKYGQADFMVIQMRDFNGATLPTDLDIRKSVVTVLQAANAMERKGGGREADGPNLPDWVELRVVDGVPVGQLMSGNKLEAFNAQTGAPVTAVPAQPVPQAAKMPPSLRQTSKKLHRFWNRRAVPGVYFELLSGVVLMTLLITGLVMYFRLLRARVRIGRAQWFWLAGGRWRGLHRAISVLAAVFLLVIAFTGTWIGYDTSWSSLGRPFGGSAPTATAGGPGLTRSTTLRLDEVPSMTATTLDAMQRLHPGVPIKVIRLRTFGSMKQGIVIAGGDKTEQLVFDATTGTPASLTEPTYPKGNFPFGVQVHENLKRIHSGKIFGLSGQYINLFAGISLLFLSVSGVTMYFDMWFRRRASRRSSFVWK